VRSLLRWQAEQLSVRLSPLLPVIASNIQGGASSAPDAGLLPHPPIRPALALQHRPPAACPSLPQPRTALTRLLAMLRQRLFASSRYETATITTTLRDDPVFKLVPPSPDDVRWPASPTLSRLREPGPRRRFLRM